MKNIKAELITRINDDIWVKAIMNEGCCLVKDKPTYDNQFKAILSSEEGTLNLSLTENKFKDTINKFVKASVNFCSKNQDIRIRVDNQDQHKTFHFHVIENKKILEDHTPLEYKNETPLKFAMKKVIEIFETKYPQLIENWKVFDKPSLTFLSKILTFTPKIDGVINFPISLAYYPGSKITMQIYSRKKQVVRLVPAGFVIERKKRLTNNAQIH